MNDLEDLELRRTRWRRARRALHLDDTACSEFGRGGMSINAGEIPVRILILPGDPESDVIGMDDEFLDWFPGDLQDPHLGLPISFRKDMSATQYGPVKYQWRSETQWKRYLSVHSSGALDMGLGSEATYKFQRDVEIVAFRLLNIVGRAAAAFSFYSTVVQEFAVEGPWEITLALGGTDGAVLGDFAVDWEQPERQSDFELQRSNVPNTLLRWEVSTWPNETGQCNALAYRVGDRLENAWGTVARRYRVGAGENVGNFDTRRYRPD